MGESLFPSPADAAGARAVRRPFDASLVDPRLVTLEGQPFLLVHRPLLCGGRRLGTVVTAVPYGAEARYEQAVLFVILSVVLITLLVLALVSHLLTDVAMVPLDRLRRFIRNHRNGAAVERLSDVANDEVGGILQAYQEMLDQSQDWADRLMESNRALRDLLTGAVEALVTAMEAKDRYTAGHSQRVADTACAVARELKWDDAAIEELRLGALFHDIGKVGISQSILNKSASLTDEEFELVRQHPVLGARILSPLPGCENIVRAILHHHEQFDGSGYPTGIRGQSIPASARIVAIADVYDALTSERSYRPAYSPEEATAILEENSGTMHDPEFLKVFLRVIRQDLGAEALADGQDGARPTDPAARPTPDHVGTPTEARA
jgi:putative nucleotidyltransferase with HDIG domain